jgi:hypothetical protein
MGRGKSMMMRSLGMRQRVLAFFLAGLVTVSMIALGAGIAGRARSSVISDHRLAMLHGAYDDPSWCRDATLPNKICNNFSPTYKQGVCDSPARVYVYRETCSPEFGNATCQSERDSVRIHDYTATKCIWKYEDHPPPPIGPGDGWHCRTDGSANPAICCSFLWTDPVSCQYTAETDGCHTPQNCAIGHVP